MFMDRAQYQVIIDIINQVTTFIRACRLHTEQNPAHCSCHKFSSKKDI